MPLRSHLHRVQPVLITAHVYEAMNRFRSAEAPRFLPVVQPDGSVAGVLRDDALKGFLFGKYGYQLVNHHPMQDFLSPCITIPVEANIETALSLYASNPNPDGLVIVEAGVYTGVLPTVSLLSMYEENRIRIQRQLMQSQKMEAIGTLAGGIAHDFNNILMPIMGYAELIRMRADLAEGRKVQQHADQILQATRRARDLVDQILSFSRQREKVESIFPLGPLIREITRLLRASVPSTIRILTSIRTSRDCVRADPGQIHQVLMNLCTNAAYAMKEKGGTLGIVLEGYPGPGEGQPDPGGWNPECDLSLSVTDTGSGMAPKVLERIFEPFFTTKPQGEGTGMGLAVVHGIVKSIGGHIAVESTVGAGTRFQMLLPRVEPAPGNAAEIPVPPVWSEDPALDQRVLVVDDEPAITRLVEEVFKQNGFPVETVNSSVEALNLVAGDPARFDLVITDQTMPQLTGIELSKRLLAIRPDLPIVLFTGFSESLHEATAKAIGVRTILKKPLSMQELVKAARTLLADTQTALRR